MTETETKAVQQMEEISPKAKSGMLYLLLSLLAELAATALIWITAYRSIRFDIMDAASALSIILSVVLIIGGFIIMGGLRILKRNEALVLTLFGKYYGTLKGEGYYFVNPFVTAMNPYPHSGTGAATIAATGTSVTAQTPQLTSKKISLKSMTLNNNKQKVNDLLGNPIEIGIVVIWHVANTAKAVFNVDNFTDYLSIQCDSALRNIVRLYPYDVAGEDSDNEHSLRGSSQEIAQRLKVEIQEKVEIAGLEITEARITHLAYAPEIAAAMLQRQQASAIIDARQMIVEGAVGMVEMALARLNENKIVELDEERKAAMVSNLLVVLCGNKDAQPVVNSGSLY